MPQPAPVPPSSPPGRYGPAPSRIRHRAALVGIGTAAALGLAWVIWAGLHQADKPLYWNTIGFQVPNSSTLKVTYNIGKDPTASAVCTLQALGPNQGVVGVAEILIGPTEDKVTQRTDQVQTSALAVSGIVKNCEIR